MIRRNGGRSRRVNVDDLTLRDVADFGVAVGVRFDVKIVDAKPPERTACTERCGKAMS